MVEDQSSGPLDVLINCYPGDMAWATFLAAHKGADDPRFDDGLVLALGDADLARVAKARLGAWASAWVRRPVPALGMRTPADVVRDGPSGLATLRSLLMRLP